MATQTAPLLSEGFTDILDTTDIALNPYNVRDWNDYTVEFNGSEFQVRKANLSVNSEATALLASFLYKTPDGFEIKINNPIITLPIDSDGLFKISSGNSRAVLLSNLFKAIKGRDVKVTVGKLDHVVDDTLTEDDLLAQQVRDNTSINLTLGQKLNLIVEYLENIEGTKTEQVEKAATQFGVSTQIVYIAKRFQSFPQWFKDKESTIFIQNGEILDKIYSLFIKAQKSIPALTLEKVWNDLEAMAAEDRGVITAGTLKGWSAKNLKKVETSEPAEDSEGSEPGETEGSSDETGFDFKESSDQEIYDYLMPLVHLLVTETDEATGEPLGHGANQILIDNLISEAYSGKRLITAAKLIEKYVTLDQKATGIETDTELAEKAAIVAEEKALAEIAAIEEASEDATEAV